MVTTKELGRTGRRPGDEMTIEQWNIVLSAVIGVLLVGYGVWLKYVFAQQLGSKDTAIQALEAALKAKDAEISRLQGDTAPAIAAAYSTMRKHANEVTEDSQRLAVQVKQLMRSQRRLDKKASADQLISECKGLFVATDIIDSEFKDIYQQTDSELGSPETLKAVVDGIVAAYQRMNNEIEHRIPSIEAIITGGEGLVSS
jgi:hypothetical protein